MVPMILASSAQPRVTPFPEKTYMCLRAMSLQSHPTLCDPMDCSDPVDCSLSGFSVHGDSPGKNTIVGCHVLPQGIFPIQGLNPHLLCLLHWQEDSLPLASPGKPQRKPSVGLIWKSGLQRWRVWCEVGRLHSFRGSDPNPRLGPNLKMNWRTAKS